MTGSSQAAAAGCFGCAAVVAASSAGWETADVVAVVAVVDVEAFEAEAFFAGFALLLGVAAADGELVGLDLVLVGSAGCAAGPARAGRFGVLVASAPFRMGEPLSLVFL